MKETINLVTPIDINGKKVKELTYDVSEISAEAFCTAFSYSSSQNSSGRAKVAVAETDASLHLYLGYEAILACNPEIDMADLERIKGMDLVTIMGIGRSFICTRSEESSDLESSEKSLEVTPESTTQESETLK